MDTSREKIRELLWQREQDSSTVISEGLAIPHIIVEGEERFDIILVRSRAGIVFPDSGTSPVHAVFCLAGTRDQRTFHLQALSAIAQVAMRPEFMNTWKRAKGVSGLRDIVSAQPSDAGTLNRSQVSGVRWQSDLSDESDASDKHIYNLRLRAYAR